VVPPTLMKAMPITHRLRTSTRSISGLAAGVCLLSALSTQASITNTVSNVGFSAYSINGTNNPTLTLIRGTTYVFNVNASGHPFWVKTVAITGTADAYDSGLSTNGVQVGTLIFTVPATAPNTLFYICQFHTAMKGTLNIIDAPPPPVVQILSLNVGSSVIVTSTGTNGWSPVPEYSYGLPATNWAPVANFTNTLANGTNTTSFDRLDTPANPEVFIRMRAHQN
jgi:hypothetical protein